MFRILPVLAVLALAISPSTAAAEPITTIVVIGDSLSDQGNAFALTGGTFPVPPNAQRASNGPVAVEYMAARLGVPLAPAAAGGTNYAVIGAATGPVAIPGTDPPVLLDNSAVPQYGQLALAGSGLLNQAAAFATTGPAFNASSTLFVVWGGPNDFALSPSFGTIGTAVANLADTIGVLYADGARQFLVPNMADLSLTPFGLAQDALTQAALQGLSVGFNLALALALDGLEQLPGIDIRRFDTFALLAMIAANPGAFGLANTSDACFAGNLGSAGAVCAAPDTFLFWDSVHPTTRGHQILGNAFAAAVPEPAVVILFALGMAATMRRLT